MILLETGVWHGNRLSSETARRYVKAEELRRGRQFEGDVAAAFQSAGWSARGVNMTELGATKAYGDVDVLAISPRGNVWRIVECKWFGAARTPREVAAWIKDFRGVEGDKLHKHLRRVDWTRSNLRSVASRLREPVPDRVEGLMATARPVPLPYLRELPEDARVLTLRELRDELG